MNPGDRLLHYRVVDKIGQGGMGEVWRAIDTTLDREVAIKMLPLAVSADPERLARFEREAKVLASLNHPNIASVYGLHADADRRFLAMELVPGQDLAERLAHGALPVDEALDAARQIAEALAEAHQQGVVHRDLKPANVKRTPDGKIKVLDFGLAKALDATSAASGADPALSPTITSLGSMAGMILGTAAYMAPEQAKGVAVDRRADVWAFGVVLFEMLSGERLFAGETVSETLASVIKDEPDWSRLPAGLPAPVRRVLRRCLAKDPRKRLRDVGDALLDLSPPALAEEESAPVAPPGTRSRERSAWIAAAVATAAAVVLGALGWLGRGPGGSEATAAVHASIPAPDGVHFGIAGDFAAPPALSPDGQSLVFGGTSSAGWGLWVYSLTTGEYRALEGTAGGTFPFWSPDGTKIGFFGDGKLRTVALAGGSPTTVCATEIGRGGAWGRDDVIVFAPGYRTPLRRVAATGGEIQDVTRLDPERHTSHRWPAFLPDSQRFLYLAISHTHRDQTELRIASLDGSLDQRVATVERNAAYADGRLFFPRGDDLLSQPFDPRTGALHGEARREAQSVLDDGTTWRTAFAVSASGGRLVYARGDSFSGTQITWYDRQGRELRRTGQRTDNDDLRLSPDGKLLAVGAGSDIWLHDVERDVRSRFTLEDWIQDWPVFTPDGKTIYYVEYGRPDGRDTILRRPTNGTGRPEVVLESPQPVDYQTLDISPDGRSLLVARGVLPFIDQSELWLVPLDGGEPYPLIEGPATAGYARFSPDGRFISYTSNETGRFEIFVVAFDQAARRLGDGRWQVTQDGGLLANWRKDGRELLFVAPDQSIRAVPVEPSQGGMRFGSPTLLFQGNFFTNGWVWDVAPDGTMVIASFGEFADRPLRLVTRSPSHSP